MLTYLLVIKVLFLLIGSARPSWTHAVYCLICFIGGGSLLWLSSYIVGHPWPTLANTVQESARGGSYSRNFKFEKRILHLVQAVFAKMHSIVASGSQFESALVMP